jgi:23S rRNA (pseudouridine1915-N3)-methyltransferase
LQRYGAVEVREVKAADSGTREQNIAQEGTRLLAALEGSDAVHILDERGTEVSSVELAELLNKCQLRGVRRLVFILGGAYGLSKEVQNRGKRLSLSRLTLPHELCRALVLEQLYRARTIQKGEPYHHE